MDDSPPISTEAEPSSMHAALPLTQVTKKDGRPYKRREDIEAQIAEAMAADPSTWDLKQLKSESLVYLIRWLWRKNDQKNIGRLIDCLGRRIARIAGDYTSGFNPTVADDFGADIACDISDHIFASTPTRQSEFLEISFRQAVERRAINRRAKLRYRRRHEISESILRTVSTEDGEIGIVAACADDSAGPEEHLLQSEEMRLTPERVRAGLSAITDERHREAVVLRFIEGWPMTDDDPAIPTLKSHFSMSVRQIQNWINTAIYQMRSALGETL